MRDGSKTGGDGISSTAVLASSRYVLGQHEVHQIYLSCNSMLICDCRCNRSSSLNEEPLFQRRSNGFQIATPGSPTMDSWSSSTLEMKPCLVPEKNYANNNSPHDTPTKEEDSMQYAAVKKGHSAYEMMIQSLEEHTKSKDNEHSMDSLSAQGRRQDATEGNGMDRQRRWMQFVCGTDSTPARPVPPVASPPAVVS